ncbi:hypothetical protein GQ53DRAFT_622393, partial [Thozetella sp. PMI_491]
EVCRRIRLYQDMAGMLYPIIDDSRMEQRASEVWASHRIDGSEGPPSTRLRQVELATLYVMTSIATISERDTTTTQSPDEGMWPSLESLIRTTRVDIEGLILLTLVAIYYDYRNQVRVAWHYVDNVTRIILEVGLNRRIVLERSCRDPKTQACVVNAIWTAFVLEQQLSSILGIRAAARDLHIDPDFPQPVEAPYLVAMVQYARIGKQACESLIGDRYTGRVLTTCAQEAVSYFQYRLEQWRKAIDTEFRYSLAGERAERWNKQLAVILRLLGNNLCVIMLHHLVENETSELSLPCIWQAAVDAAADTSRLLADMDGSSSTCLFQKSRTNRFLVRAMSISILAVYRGLLATSKPSSRNSVTILFTPETQIKARETTLVCLQLLKNRSESSPLSRRLWVRMQKLAARLDL